MPEGGYYAWPNVSQFGLSSFEFAKFVLEQERVLVGPGNTFGPQEGEGYLRVSCSPTEQEIREGLQRLAAACKKLRAR